MNSAYNLLQQHKKVTMSLCAILLLMTGAGAVYGLEHYQYMQSPEGKAEQKVAAAKKEMGNAIAKAQDQIALPKDEEAVLATVSDRDKLKNQSFFQKAKNGDQLLMYPKNKKIYLYRPDTQKVIAVSALNFGDPTPTPLPQSTNEASSAARKVLIQTEQ